MLHELNLIKIFFPNYLDSVPNEMNFEAYDETSENFDESLDSKTEQSSMNNNHQRLKAHVACFRRK